MGYYTAVKRNELLIYVTIWMNVENIVVSEVRPHIVQFYLFEISRICKSIEALSRLAVARGLGGWRMGSDY